MYWSISKVSVGVVMLGFLRALVVLGFVEIVIQYKEAVGNDYDCRNDCEYPVPRHAFLRRL